MPLVMTPLPIILGLMMAGATGTAVNIPVPMTFLSATKDPGIATTEDVFIVVGAITPTLRYSGARILVPIKEAWAVATAATQKNKT